MDNDHDPSFTVSLEPPDTPEAMLLISELEAELEPLYPSKSRHGLSVERLIAEQVAFFVLRADGVPAACGGVKLVGMAYGELKRMYVRPQYRRSGFATALLNHLTDFTRAHGVEVLRLETGIHQHSAIRLYEREGFHRIPPFASYEDDPLSVFFEKSLS